MRDDFVAARNERYLPGSRRSCTSDTSETMRRVGEFLIACVLLAITLPLLIFTAIAVRCNGPGPVLEAETCLGSDGRRFRKLKFRMVAHDPTAATRPPWRRRMTRLGAFLHRTRIASLPQLINVLRGEMSFLDRAARSPSLLD
jgi:lipopolysaccharide/colanic/teichoic acid biosynthesis glycosyltransferase